MPESSGNKATLSCQLFFFVLRHCPLTSVLSLSTGPSCVILVQPVGCHCGIPAVGIGLSNFYCAWNINLIL